MTNWTLRLTTTLILNDGRSVDTLAEAVKLIMAVDKAGTADWLLAMRSLKAAANEGSYHSVQTATGELLQTLVRSGMMTMH